MEIRPFQPTDAASVIALWEKCNLVVPWNDPQKDIARKLARDADLFLVGILDGMLVASVMAGYEGHRGWINYLAVDPDMQKHGLGRMMMATAEKRVFAMGCPKINLQVRERNTGVIKFYRKLGYSIDPVVSMGKRLTPDD